jgi:hypothetical protein
MIKEAYVSFETAKLLKEKGFDEPCYMSYWLRTKDNIELAHLEQHCNNYSDCMCAPTLQMGCAWLREIHNIDIEIRRSPNTMMYKCLVYKDTLVKCITDAIMETYEDAVEAALKYTLEDLI